jgi:hypothetical protein
MTIDDSKLEILRKVEQGALSIEEGAHLLEILEGGSSAQYEDAAPASAVSPVASQRTTREPLEVPAGWRSLWGIFLWLGIIFMGLSGYWLLGSYNRSGLGVGFWFALFFLLISCAILFFGLQLLSSRWMMVHIRSTEAGGEKKFTVWVPLPLQLARWVFHNFGSYMPESVKSRHIESILQEMEQSNEPYQVEIDGEKGSQANINIEF